MLTACLPACQARAGLTSCGRRWLSTASDPRIPYLFRPFGGPLSLKQLPGRDGHAKQLQAGGKRPHCRRRRMQRAVPPPMCAAAVPSPGPLAADAAGAAEEVHQGRLAALLHPFSNLVANTKLLALCSGLLLTQSSASTSPVVCALLTSHHCCCHAARQIQLAYQTQCCTSPTTHPLQPRL